MEEISKTAIEIDPLIESLMEERGIGLGDIQGVLAYGEESKNIYRDMTSGRFLVYHRPARVTYWVEYGREGDVYRVYRVYSHRMEILHGFNMPPKLKGVSTWMCLKCDMPLELATIKLRYLEETFGADLPACPSCQRVFVSEETALEKMALAEKMLEDK
jgi:hypothetical protein